MLLMLLCQQVNSGNIPFGNPPLDWPYMVGGLASAPVMMHEGAVNHYPVHGQPATLGSSYPAPTRSSRSLPNPYGFPSSNGPEYYGYPVANDNLEPFAYHQGLQQGFSTPGDGSPHPAMYSSQESMRQWPSGLPNPRCGSNSYDQDLSLNRYPTSTTSSYGSLHSAQANSDSQSMFPGMSAITNSLPSSAVLGDRFLPDPRANTVLPSTSDAIQPTPVIGGLETKPPLPLSNSERGSLNSSTGMPSSVKSASPSDATFSEAPSLSFSARSSVSSAYPVTNATAFESEGSAVGTPPASYQGLSAAPLSRPRAPLSMAASASATYSYGMDRKRGSQSSTDGSPAEATLMSGRQYTQLVPRPATHHQHPTPVTGTGHGDEMTKHMRGGSVARGAAAMH